MAKVIAWDFSSLGISQGRQLCGSVKQGAEHNAQANEHKEHSDCVLRHALPFLLRMVRISVVITLSIGGLRYVWLQTTVRLFIKASVKQDLTFIVLSDFTAMLS